MQELESIGSVMASVPKVNELFKEVAVTENKIARSLIAPVDKPEPTSIYRETQAMYSAANAIEDLDAASQRRVLDYLVSRFQPTFALGGRR